MKFTSLFPIVAAALVGFSAQADPIELTFSGAALANSPHGMTVTEISEALATDPEGDVKLNVHLGGSLYSQDQQDGALRRGLIDMSYTGFQWIGDRVPRYSMFASGYFFRDQAHMSAVLDGPIGQEIYDDVAEELGIRVLAAFYFGQRTLNHRDVGYPILTPDDMADVNLRMPNSEAWMRLGRAMGAQPTPISIGELYLALNTGTVDAQDNPLPVMIQRRFYEVAENVLLTGHVIAANLVVINEDTWQGMSEDQQATLMAAIDEGRASQRDRVLAAEAEARTFLEGEGVTFTEPDLDVWIEHVRQYYRDSGAMDSWDMDLYERVQAVGSES